MAKTGVAIAADSQATDLEAGIKIVADDKLCRLGTHLVWGFSGAVGLKQLIRPALEAAHAPDWKRKTIAELRMPIPERIATVRKAVAAQHLIAQALPSAEAMVVGVTGPPGMLKPWILECPSDNIAQEHFRFCAIGSGKKAGYHGYESLRHYEPHEQPIGLAKLFLFRIMDDAIRAEGFGVGGQIHLWSVTNDGAVEEPGPAMEDLAQLLDQWRQTEKEGLRGLMKPPGDEPGAEALDTETEESSA
ncbi:MAG: hypothetical protein WD359_06855 [Dehalococcoidia bacterium]